MKKMHFGLQDISLQYLEWPLEKIWGEAERRCQFQFFLYIHGTVSQSS